MRKIDCEEVKLLKQSEKSTVLLVREIDGEQLYVQKVLKGQHKIYTELLDSPHPFLPKLYEYRVKLGSNNWIEFFEFNSSISGREPPVDSSALSISAALPSGDIATHFGDRGNFFR